MTKTYSNELQQALINTSVVDGKTKAYQATIDLNSQASGDTIVIAKALQGEKFVAGIITSDTSNIKLMLCLQQQIHQHCLVMLKL